MLGRAREILLPVQVANLRYSRLKICATPEGSGGRRFLQRPSASVESRNSISFARSSATVKRCTPLLRYLFRRSQPVSSRRGLRSFHRHAAAMKIPSPLIGLALIAIVRAVAQAQITRTFDFTNRGDGLTTKAPIYDSEGNLLAGTGYLAQLYVGQDQDSLQPLLPVKSFLTGALAGYLLPSSIEAEGLGGSTDLFAFQIRAWDASLGSTYAEALAQGRGGVGESNIAMEAAGISRGGPPLLPGPVIGLQSFSLSPLVPEPSTYALFGVGAVALWWQCRRSRQ